MKRKKKLERKYIRCNEQIHEIFYRSSCTMYINLNSKSNIIIYKT